MLRNHLLKISLLLPLVAMSSTVASASASVDLQKRLAQIYQHRPDQPAEYGALAQVRQPAATYKTNLQGRRSLQPVGSPKACTYQGGPKSGLWACR
jgi:hypothetical protein